MKHIMGIAPIIIGVTFLTACSSNSSKPERSLSISGSRTLDVGRVLRGKAAGYKYVGISTGNTIWQSVKVNSNGSWKLTDTSSHAQKYGYVFATNDRSDIGDNLSSINSPKTYKVKFSSNNIISEKNRMQNESKKTDDVSTSSSTSATPASVSSNSKSSTKTKVTLAQTNAKIADTLKQNQGWAAGKIDANGNPTDDGTPNESFRWTTYINSIKMDKSQILTVQVNGKINILTDDSKKDLAIQSQNLVLGVMAELGTATDADYNGLYTNLMSGEIVVGHSTLRDNKTIKLN